MDRLGMLREDYRTNEDNGKHPCDKGPQRRRGTEAQSSEPACRRNAGTSCKDSRSRRI